MEPAYLGKYRSSLTLLGSGVEILAFRLKVDEVLRVIRHALGATFVAITLLSGAAAHAGYTSANYDQTIGGFTGAGASSSTNYGPGTYDRTVVSPDGFSTLHNYAQSSFDPAPNAGASVENNGVVYGGSSAHVDYTLTGTLGANPDGVTSIPVYLKGHVEVYAVGTQVRSQAQIGATGAGVEAFYCGVSYDTGGCVDEDFLIPFSLTADASVANLFHGQVDLYVKATSTIFSVDDDTVQNAGAFIDPIIYLDPSFLAAHPGTTLNPDGSTLFDSPPGGGAVPEPSAWVMLLAGFLATGAALRRRLAPAPT